MNQTTHAPEQAIETQWIARAAAVAELGRRLGFELRQEFVPLGTVSIEVDGIDRSNRFFCRSFVRIGNLRAPDVEELGSEILKLLLVEQVLKGKWRKAICFVDDAGKRLLHSRLSWLAAAARAANVEDFVVNLPSDVRSALLREQARDPR